MSFLCRLISCCSLEIESEINFGAVIANSKIISKEITITNRGSSSGKYLLHVKLYKYFGFFENVILCKLTLHWPCRN